CAVPGSPSDSNAGAACRYPSGECLGGQWAEQNEFSGRGSLLVNDENAERACCKATGVDGGGRCQEAVDASWELAIAHDDGAAAEGNQVSVEGKRCFVCPLPHRQQASERRGRTGKPGRADGGARVS